MTTRTGVRNLVGVRHRRGNEPKGVTAHILIGEGLFDLRHMARDAFAAGAAGLMVCVLFDRTGVWSVRSARAVAFEAHHAGRLNE